MLSTRDTSYTTNQMKKRARRPITIHDSPPNVRFSSVRIAFLFRITCRRTSAFQLRPSFQVVHMKTPVIHAPERDARLLFERQRSQQVNDLASNFLSSSFLSNMISGPHLRSVLFRQNSDIYSTHSGNAASLGMSVVHILHLPVVLNEAHSIKDHMRGTLSRVLYSVTLAQIGQAMGSRTARHVWSKNTTSLWTRR